jgi:predicted 2-oxoglutarate/Fe(II)-dependent dioxygenase YbiX
MAAQLWRKLAAHVRPHVHDAGAGDFSFSGQLAAVPPGVYDPVGVADLLRFSRYTSGGNFSAHRDTCYARDVGYVGFLTVLVFLGDDDLTGGETVVYRDDDVGEHRVRPEPGKALVFYHHRQHKGAEVTGGTKHVVRTEIMFSHHASR